MRVMNTSQSIGAKPTSISDHRISVPCSSRKVEKFGKRDLKRKSTRIRPEKMMTPACRERGFVNKFRRI
jgi:hypothetical protein